MQSDKNHFDHEVKKKRVTWRGSIGFYSLGTADFCQFSYR